MNDSTQQEGGPDFRIHPDNCLASEAVKDFLDIVASHDPDRVKCSLLKFGSQKGKYLFLEFWPACTDPPKRQAQRNLLSQIIINGRSPEEIFEVHGPGHFRLTTVLRDKNGRTNNILNNYFTIASPAKDNEIESWVSVEEQIEAFKSGGSPLNFLSDEK